MRGKRKLGGWLFLAGVILAHGATALVEPDLARRALASFVTMLGEVAPVLVLVFVLIFLAERFSPPGAPGPGWARNRDCAAGCLRWWPA